MYDLKKMKEALFVLRSLGVNYPILKEYGLGLSKLLLVIVGEGQTPKAKALLSDSDVPSVDEFMSVREVKKVFMDANSTFIIYPYAISRKSQDFLSLLEIIARTGEIAGIKINALPLVISEGIPLGYDLQRSFTVFFEGDLADVDIDLDEVVPFDEELTVVEDKLRSFLPNATSPDEKTLLAAACFLYPNMARAGRQEQFEQILLEAKNLVARNEENRDTDGLEEAFIRTLYSWQEENNFCEVFELPYLEMQVVEQMEEVMLFDGTYVYMKDELLKKICEPLLDIFSIDIVKQELVRVGILCPSANNTYTVKVGFYNLAGGYERVRMLRFVADKLKYPGEMDFLELCIEEKGEGTDGNIFNSNWKL